MMELWDAYDRNGNKLDFDIKRGEMVRTIFCKGLSETNKFANYYHWK